jgi:FKBP-type peptidyl-prolyl cis-trans isomerase FkpA
MKLLFFSVLFLLLACSPSESTSNINKEITAEDEKAIEQTFVKANQQLIQKENDDMDYYAQSHQLNFVKTNSGIRYCVYKPSAKGDSIKARQSVVMQYTLSLLDGTVCYSSDTEGKKVFMVEQGEIESGIHRGLQYLKRGDKALLLIPSVLAHGLLGDMKKIPPQMPILYDVEVE